MARIAIVLDDDYEDSEYEQPAQRLRDAGHELTVLGMKQGEVRGKRGDSRVELDGTIADADPADFDALLIPGGYSPDHLRADATVVKFVKHFHTENKLIAAVCHGPSLLIDADAVRDHRLTSWPSIRQDLRNAGATVVDEEVVVDGKLITSRKPDDLPAFCAAIESALAA